MPAANGKISVSMPIKVKHKIHVDLDSDTGFTVSGFIGNLDSQFLLINWGC